jgi:hypothetical protein
VLRQSAVRPILGRMRRCTRGCAGILARPPISSTAIRNYTATTSLAPASPDAPLTPSATYPKGTASVSMSVPL